MAVSNFNWPAVFSSPVRKSLQAHLLVLTLTLNLCLAGYIKMKRFLICLIWIPAALFTLTAAFLSLNQVLEAQEPPELVNQTANYSSYFSLPRVLGSSTVDVQSDDMVPQAVKTYTQGTPLEDYAQYMVDICERYDPHGEYPLVFWYLAIAKIESGLCRVIPNNSHNCTGWGIHSAGTLKYPTYEAAIESWCQGFSSKYLNHPKYPKTTPDEVVKWHTPHSPIDPNSGRQIWAIKIQRELDTLMGNN